MEPQLERRRHTRFRAISGAFAGSTNGSAQIGPIKDISRGGLAFHYIDSGQQQGLAEQIDIFIAGNKLHIKELPVKPVIDIELTEDIPFSSVPMRQMSVQFGELKESQRAALENFLINHTAGRA